MPRPVSAATERLLVKCGIGTLETPMTRAQALRWGRANIAPDLKRVGFVCSVCRSDATLHGGDWFRINYSK